jgi:hypothetical protein
MGSQVGLVHVASCCHLFSFISGHLQEVTANPCDMDATWTPIFWAFPTARLNALARQLLNIDVSVGSAFLSENEQCPPPVASSRRAAQSLITKSPSRSWG